MNTLTDSFINLLHETSQSPFSADVLSQAKRCLIDYLGCAYAGSILLCEKTNSYLDYVPDGQAPVIGMGRKAEPHSAAFANALNAHVAELDDGERRGSVHPGAPVISGLLSVGAQYKISGGDFLRGMITGYEAAIRLADAIQPAHRNKGFHATGTCGGIGAAIAIAAALGFTKQQMKNALSAAAASSAGLLNVIKGGSELKPYNAGHAAVSGILAAQTARAGFEGSHDVLAGQWGLLSVLTDKYDASMLTGETTGKYAIERVYMKPYAACRHCHPAIEAALALRECHDIDPLTIKQITVRTYNLANGGHEHTEIDNSASAKMSTPFSVAVALITGKAGINEFAQEQIKDAATLYLAKKVRVVTDDDLNSLVPDKRPADVTIETDSATFTHRVDLAKGEPESPLTLDEVCDKMTQLVVFAGHTPQHAGQLKNCALNIEASFEELLGLV